MNKNIYININKKCIYSVGDEICVEVDPECDPYILYIYIYEPTSYRMASFAELN